MQKAALNEHKPVIVLLEGMATNICNRYYIGRGVQLNGSEVKSRLPYCNVEEERGSPLL